MKPLFLFAAAALAVSVTAVDAGNGKHCPPGLAKKGSCVPPGQMKRYGVGDIIIGGYHPVTLPARHRKRDGYYIRAGDYVYEIDRDTHKVLNLVGAIADILN
jgi:hypothetical protein